MTKGSRAQKGWMGVGLLLICLIALNFPSPIHAEGFTNPLGNIEDINVFLTRIINWLLGIVGLLALLAIIWGGIRLIAAFGNEQQVADAKKIIKWAIVGLTIVVLSWVIVQIVAIEILGAT